MRARQHNPAGFDHVNRGDPMTKYGQFCPVAKAAEIIAERWTPLILRELLMGSRRFNQLERGLPRISRSLLSQRLRFLEEAGLLTRGLAADGRTQEYELTAAGRDLYDVIFHLGEWSHRWFDPVIDDDDLDPQLLMWDIRRGLHLDRLPLHRVLVQFDFTGVAKGSYWLLLEPGDPSVCWDHPGFPVDLTVHADTRTLARVWMGHQAMTDAISKRLISLDGPRELTGAFPEWLALSTFAGTERHYEPELAAT
jgi:DNA-binding HxlR family transcriptional regulator